MNLDLKDKVIIVTGGASGIGESIVRTLAIEHARPVIFDLKSANQCAELLEELKIEHVDGAFISLDLTKEDQVAEAVSEIGKRFGRIDGIVNNAGVNDSVGLNRSPADFSKSLEKNLVQCFSVVHHALNFLKKSDAPAIVNIASKVAITGQGGTSGYAAAKGGLLALTREWALDLASDCVRVNAVVPAEVWTPMYENWLSTLSDPDARRAEIEANIPLGNRMTEAAEIADTTTFLLSPRASHTTGQILHVDGGYVHFDRAYQGKDT